MSKATINEYNYNHLMSEHELMAGILTYFNKHTHNVTHQYKHTHTHTHTHIVIPEAALGVPLGLNVS